LFHQCDITRFFFAPEARLRHAGIPAPSRAHEHDEEIEKGWLKAESALDATHKKCTAAIFRDNGGRLAAMLRGWIELPRPRVAPNALREPRSVSRAPANGIP
jgi:hypothetical protein